MRELFNRFPEVVMIDATHGTNASKYEVFSLVAHDAFGKGQFVQHAVGQNERRLTLMTALEEFKQNNPAWSRIKCIIIDKDFTEMSVLKEVFPDVIVLLCQFHVLKYLREEIARTDYGFTTWQKQQLQSIMNLLVYAKTEREYNKYRAYMRHVIAVGTTSSNQSSSRLGAGLGVDGGRLGAELNALGVDGGRLASELNGLGDAPVHPFEAYFVKNWDNCRSMWCAFERQNTVTLGNNTNNRIEPSWKQLKDLVNSFMGVDECIASIMWYQSLEEQKFLNAVHKLAVVHNPKYDREMQFVANLVGEHACELIFDQYEFAISRAKYTYYEPVPDMILIRHDSEDEDALDEPRAEYSVSKRDWFCSCLFMSSRLLPRRHVFFLRKALSYENIIPTQLLNPRWLLTTMRTSTDMEEYSGESFGVSTVLQDEKSNTVWDSNRKFREANSVATTISDHMSSLGRWSTRQP